MKISGAHLILSFCLLPARAHALELTVYSTIHESDFSKTEMQVGEWTTYEDMAAGNPPHQSLFAKGFLDRESSNPTNDRLSGVAMEGNGFMEPALHTSDSDLNAEIEIGYTVITLHRWDESTHTAKFVLSKAPLNMRGTALIDHVSAAVKLGNKLYPVGRWVRIDVAGKFFQYRKIDDECSSCVEDQIDLYYDNAATAPDIEADTPATATVMPEDFTPSVSAPIAMPTRQSDK